MNANNFIPGIITLSLEVSEKTAKAYLEANRAMPLEALPAMLAEAIGNDPPSPLLEIDQAILDLLRNLLAPMTAAEIAQAISNSHDYVRERLAPGAPLRSRRLIDHKRGSGYFAVQCG